MQAEVSLSMWTLGVIMDCCTAPPVGTERESVCVGVCVCVCV